MTEISFRLDETHLAALQRACRERGRLALAPLTTPRFSFFIACTVVPVLLVSALAELAVFPHLLGRGFGMEEYMLGFFVGLGGFFVINHWRDRTQVALMKLRPEGTVLGEQRVTLNSDGLTSTNALRNWHYRWTALQELTVHNSILALWVEPCVALVIPRNAFADPAAEQGFIDTARNRMMMSRLPRSSSSA